VQKPAKVGTGVEAVEEVEAAPNIPPPKAPVEGARTYDLRTVRTENKILINKR
jgi:hypothetical protein